MKWGFHEGELAAQRAAGVSLQAQRLEGMLAPADLSGGAQKFLSLRSYAVLTGRDHDGVLWASPLAAPPGFLDARGDVLQIATTPRTSDPLHGLPAYQPVGLIVIDFATRRRIRVNGTLTEAGQDRLVVRVDQAYGNCPQHIHPHDLAAAVAAGRSGGAPHRAVALTPQAQALVAASDTFFLGTTHPSRGSDASHRGGPPAFVQVSSPTRLWWPDYPGNNMFNSFGNLQVDDEAALLFTDYATGATVQMSGTAQVVWSPQRRVEFTVRQVVDGLSAHQPA